MARRLMATGTGIVAACALVSGANAADVDVDLGYGSASGGYESRSLDFTVAPAGSDWSYGFGTSVSNV